MRVLKKIKYCIKECWRFPYRKYMAMKLRNFSFSLISANCIGGILSHDCCQQFRSPTINLIIPQYLKFVKNLEYYLSQPIMGGGGTIQGWPIAIIDDIEIIGVHYHDHKELISSWQRRKARINYKNIFLIATDEYIYSKKDIEEFSKLPYPKVLFQKSPKREYSFQVYIPKRENYDNVGDILRYKNIFGERIFERYFDCIKWLNENKR